MISNAFIFTNNGTSMLRMTIDLLMIVIILPCYNYGCLSDEHHMLITTLLKYIYVAFLSSIVRKAVQNERVFDRYWNVNDNLLFIYYAGSNF